MTIELDTRLLSYLVWGLGTSLLFGVVLDRRRRSWKKRKDARARREVLQALGLFIVALSANISILLGLFGPDGQSMRALFAPLSLGAFTAVGVLMVTDKEPT